MSGDAASPARRPRPPRLAWTRHWASAVLLAAVASACTGGDGTTSGDADPDASAAPAVTETIDGVVVETRSRLGPLAIDDEREMTLAVDSMHLVDDDILVRVRVTNDGDQALAIGADDTLYGPLVVLHDDLSNTYPARAVEPAGVYAHSTGLLELRVDGPLDPGAAEFTVELSTDRGPLETEPTEVPTGDAVRWWSGETTTSDVATYADLPHLPELIHAQISNDSASQPALGPPVVDGADG